MVASMFINLLVRAAPLAALTPVIAVPTYMAVNKQKPAQSQPAQPTAASLAPAAHAAATTASRPTAR
eukprot:SAG31_NODE_13819_length_844_cov_1.127517_1_plen_66_part_10